MSIEEGNTLLTDLCAGGPGVFDEDDDSDGWNEMDVSGEQTTCLFCPLQFHTIAVALDHCRTQHNFDLLALKNKYNMDCYSYIKMINYIRLHNPEPKILTDASVALWDDEVYMKPGEMETWLMYDFDDLGSAPSTPHYAIDGKTPISNLNFSELQRQIQDLNMQIRHKDLLLENYMRDMAKMKEVTRTIFETGDKYDKKLPHNVASLSSENTDYFSSYSHFGIHHDMLNDTVRTQSYQNAILENSDSFKGKTVLDVGCGTGILSMFAAKAGAQKVYGIDQSDVIYKAMEIIRENGLSETIDLIKGQMEKTELPVDKVDILISEWMGYFLLFEGMLDSFICARDTYLKSDGLVIPNRCNMIIVGISDLDRYDKVVNFWDNVYGFSMQCMKNEVLKEAFVETVSEDKIVTNPFIINELDLKTCNINACIFSSKFSFRATKDCVLTTIAGYFDVFFELEKKIEFSTGPHAPKTHWQQTLFFLGNTVNLKDGDTIDGTLSCTRLTKNVRGLSVTITIGANKYQYILD